MANPIIVGSDPKAVAAPQHTGPWWRVITVLGLLLVIVGGFDLTLLWYPSQFGSPEFEFATASRFLSSLPVLTMGLGLLIAVGVMRGQRGALFAAGTVCVLIAVVAALALILFALNIPLALRAAPGESLLRIGVKKAIAKGLFEGVMYTIGYLAMAWVAIRHFRGLHQKA